MDRLQMAHKAWTNLKRKMNLDVKYDDNTMSSEVILPGLSYDDFDRTGNPSAWKILRLAECGRLFDKTIDRARQADRASQTRQQNEDWTELVKIGQRLNIKPAFYSYARLNSPMVYSVQPCHIGKYSFSNKVTIMNPYTGEILLTSIPTFAARYAKSGKSLPLSSDFSEIFKPNASNPKPPRLPTLQLPPSGNVYKFSIRATHSDMDVLFHINSATYVRFCVDCATEASLAGFIKNFTGDPCFLHVEKIETYHSDENFAGDELTVYTWEPITDRIMLHFLIYNKKKPTQPVFHCSILFRFSKQSKL